MMMHGVHSVQNDGAQTLAALCPKPMLYAAGHFEDLSLAYSLVENIYSPRTVVCMHVALLMW
jgi:hypothetical protein